MCACRPGRGRRVQTIPAGRWGIASILIIDDEESIRIALRRALEQAGYQVHDAATGNDGLRRVRTAPPALVITDVLMPDADGLEVLIALRRERPGLPIIAMTGAPENSDYLEAARLLGARRVLKKPCSIPALLQAVEEALQHGSPSASVERRGTT